MAATHYAFPFPFSIPEQLAEVVVLQLKPIGDVLLEYASPLYEVFNNAARQAGMQADIFIFVVLLLSSLVFSFIHRHLLPNNPTLKHFYSAGVGLFFAFFSYGYAALISLFTVIICYLFMLVLPRNQSPKAVISFCFVGLCYIHIYRMITAWNSSRVDFSGMHMMLLVRLFIACMNYYDGSKPESELHFIRARSSIKSLPSPIQFLGFAFYYPTILAGPVFDIKHYLDFQEQYGFKKLPGKYSYDVIKRILFVFISVTIFAKALPLFSRDIMLNGTFYQFSLFKKLWCSFVMILFFTSKYHMVWYLAEASLILSGMGFNGYDENKKPKWDRVLQTDMVKFELATNPQQLAGNWNISIHKAFKTYLYFSANKDAKPGAKNVAAVYFASAIWHGFYPGYYIFFGLLGWGTYFSRLYQRSYGRLLYVKDPKSWRDLTIPHMFGVLVSWSVMHVEVYWSAISFLLLSFDETLKYWKSVYYAPLVLIAVATAFGHFSNWALPKMFPSLMVHEKKEKHQHHQKQQ